MRAGGLTDGKVLRVVGLASAVPLDKAAPAGATNRRISIIVLNKKTEEAITREGTALEVNTKDSLDVQQLDRPPAQTP
jgi:chemotaxis protein MotB